MSTSALSFALSPSSSTTTDPSTHKAKFGPRIGRLVLERSTSSASTSSDSPASGGGATGEARAKARIDLDTPALFTTTSRGVVPHISRDHYDRLGGALKWTCVPFETFLEHNPPVPVLYASSPSSSPPTPPLHGFLGFKPRDTILALTARDPGDVREMPTNGNDALCVATLRGVRRASPKDFSAHTTTLLPDVVTALSDTPFTNPPYSQKRLTKSIERSALWLASLLSGPTSASPTPTPPPPFAVFAHLAGLTSIPARKAFSHSLLEPLDTSPTSPKASTYVSGMPGVPSLTIAPGKDGERVKTLDDGVSGYTADLAPIVQNLEIRAAKASGASTVADAGAAMKGAGSRVEEIAPLLEASLGPLPSGKPRLVNGVQGPHDILRLISEVGIDLFDAGWAQRCADVGVVLDFEFPASSSSAASAPSATDGPSLTPGSKLQLGRNLYDPKYAYDFSPLGDASCICNACRPVQPPTRLYHGVDTPSYSGEAAYPSERANGGEGGEKEGEEYGKPFTRAYIHHLLHTHEMSAHTLLVMHNLGVVERFFSSIRAFLASSSSPIPNPTTSRNADMLRSKFTEEIARFAETYDETFAVVREARKEWREVDMARGKGRLAREKEREDAARAHEAGVDP